MTMETPKWPKVEIVEDVTTNGSVVAVAIVGSGIIKPTRIRLNGTAVYVPQDSVIEIRHRDQDLLEVRLSLFVAEDDFKLGIESDNPEDQPLVAKVHQKLLEQLHGGRVIEINAEDGFRLDGAE